MKKIFYTITCISLIITFAGCDNNKPNNDSLLYATLYQQNAAENEALYYQAFNIARLRLDQILKDSSFTLSPVIVVDIDETVLNNSPFEAKSIIHNNDYPTYWKEWCEEASAKATPGAVEFLSYAKSKGVNTYYITNRKAEFQEVTMKNLEKLGFPCVEDEFMLFKTSESNKESRRNKVRENNEIVMLMGDNLNDFTSLYQEQPLDKRHSLTKQMKEEFGKKFIVLPNPMYGAWVDALLQYQHPGKEEFIKILKSKLEAF